MILYLLIKKAIYLNWYLKKKQNFFKSNLRSQPYTKNVQWFFISGHKSKFLCVDFNIFSSLVSFLFSLKYWPKWLNFLILINRNIFFLCFFSLLWVSKYAKRANFFRPMWSWAPSLKCVLNTPSFLNSHCNASSLAHVASLPDYCSSCHCTLCSTAYPMVLYHVYMCLTL